MLRFRNPWLKDVKIVLRSSRTVLRCTNSQHMASFRNRVTNDARSILELLEGGLKGKLEPRRLKALRWSCI